VASLWVALALVWFLPLDTPHLFNPDEGRYAEIPREMVASGDWVTPRLDAIKYFEKPPLQYWATAVAYEAAGQHAWTARLWSALCGFLGLGLTYGLGRRLYGERAALFAVIVQGGALLYFGLARVATLDMGLCFTLQLAMTALALLVHWPGSRRYLPLLLGVGVALAMLSKGLIGVLIPGAVALLFMLVHRDARLLRSSRPWWTLAALVVLAAPWFVLVSLRNPAFARFFFLFEHFQRFLSPAGFNRYHALWYFVPVLAAGLVPWITLLPRTLIGAVRAALAGERATALLAIWAAFVFVFFSLSQSKLVPYVLPVVPAVALLMGRALVHMPPRRLAAHLRFVAIAAALLAAALLVAWWLPVMARQVANASTATIIGFIAAFALMALGAAVGTAWSRRGHMLAGAAAAAAGALLFSQSALLAIDQLPRIRATVTLAQQLRPWIDDYRHFYCVGAYVQTVPFELKRTCTPVGYRGELAFGLTLEPGRAVADLPQFLAIWREQSSALAILEPAEYRRLTALGAPMHVIYTAPSFVAVVRQ
jgi:4-amino-4-deoxy-L-arabinose transferase-like glycosyltransferase